MYPNESMKNITFIITENCNFSCTYCYLPHKNSKNKMSFSVAKQAIDSIFENDTLFPEDAVYLDFIGGEPLLETELIGKIIHYFLKKSYELNHRWFHSTWVGMSTNGSLYTSEKFQQILRLLGSKIGVSISIDGTKRVHDLCRINKKGLGTYDSVVEAIPLWLKQYPNASTKVTYSHETLPFIMESVLHLFELGIREINANVVFEKVWKPGDEQIFEEQLNQLGEAIISNRLFDNHNCSLFSRHIGKPIDNRDDQNWCGTGKMLAIDASGNFYPCNRFTPLSLQESPPRMIGNIQEGIDQNLLRPFLALTRSSQSPAQCMKCEVASGCAWCQGLNYQDSPTQSIYFRATHICEMHKARVRANHRFWSQVDTLGLPWGEK